MKTCLRCGCNTVDEVKFCPECGTAFPPPQEMPPPPQYTQAPPPPPPYGYAPPMPPAPQKPKPPAQAKAIVGMVLSINGLVGAAIGLLALIWIAALLFLAWGMMMSDGYYDPDLIFMQGFFRVYTLVVSLALAGETMPCAIVGRFLGKKAQEEGNETKIAENAVKLGKIGVILSIVMLGIGVLCTAAMYRM